MSQPPQAGQPSRQNWFPGIDTGSLGRPPGGEPADQPRGHPLGAGGDHAAGRGERGPHPRPGGAGAKQLVRNIESALLAQLGLKVDHRRISIAQTADVKPIEALERDTGAGQGAPVRGAVREREAWRRGKRPHRLSITVTLSFRGTTETADEEISDTPRSRVEGAAKAAVTVIDRLLSDFSVALEGAKIVEAFDRNFAFVGVQELGGRESLLHDRHSGDQGERRARGGVRGAGCDEPGGRRRVGRGRCKSSWARVLGTT